MARLLPEISALLEGSRRGVMGISRRQFLTGLSGALGLAVLAPYTNCAGNNSQTTGTVAPSAAGSAIVNAAYTGHISILGTGWINSPIGGGGAKIIPRGVGIEDYDGAALAGANGGLIASGGNWVNDTNTPGQGPNTAQLALWKPNCVRIGVGQSSWLGERCFDNTCNGDGATGWHNPNSTMLDCNGTFRTQLVEQIAALNAIGCYVILVSAFTNPGASAAYGQDLMASQDNSIQFWQSMAEWFGYPNGTQLKRNGGTIDDGSVIFELFNEPQVYAGNGASDYIPSWQMLMNGGWYSGPYSSDGPGPWTPIYPFPCNTPTPGTHAGVPAGQYFMPGEAFTSQLPNGGGAGPTGNVHCYFLNTTTGLPSSGLQQIHLRNMSSTILPVGTLIRGKVSGAVCMTQAPPSGSANNYGWYQAGHAQMLAAIRTAGAQNPCFLSGANYSGDLSLWPNYAPADTTPPTGFVGNWIPQIGAVWHNYPPTSYINAIAVATGGKGYSVNDTILLPMPESGAESNTCYWQAQVKVTAVGAGGAITGVALQSYTGGSPGVAGGDPSTLGFNGVNNMVGGMYLSTNLPTNPVGTYSTSGSGAGATFNLTFKSVGFGITPWSWIGNIQTMKKCPVWITETADHSGVGVDPTAAPWIEQLYQVANTYGVGISYHSYSPNWPNATGTECGLVRYDGKTWTPTPGYGTVVKSYLAKDNTL